jgi:hypothetical protein
VSSLERGSTLFGSPLTRHHEQRSCVTSQMDCFASLAIVREKTDIVHLWGSNQDSFFLERSYLARAYDRLAIGGKHRRHRGLTLRLLHSHL